MEPGLCLGKVRLCLAASLTHQAFPAPQPATWTLFVASICCTEQANEDFYLAFSPRLLTSSNFGMTLFILKFVQQLLVLNVGAMLSLLNCTFDSKAKWYTIYFLLFAVYGFNFRILPTD
jgi:hypothetical protein